jgi:hypothetical protein
VTAPCPVFANLQATKTSLRVTLSCVLLSGLETTKVFHITLSYVGLLNLWITRISPIRRPSTSVWYHVCYKSHAWLPEPYLLVGPGDYKQFSYSPLDELHSAAGGDSPSKQFGGSDGYRTPNFLPRPMPQGGKCAHPWAS